MQAPAGGSERQTAVRKRVPCERLMVAGAGPLGNRRKDGDVEPMWRAGGQNQLGWLLVESVINPGLGAGSDRVVSRARQLEGFRG